jgi:hypothetical protein
MLGNNGAIRFLYKEFFLISVVESVVYKDLHCYFGHSAYCYVLVVWL